MRKGGLDLVSLMKVQNLFACSGVLETMEGGSESEMKDN